MFNLRGTHCSVSEGRAKKESAFLQVTYVTLVLVQVAFMAFMTLHYLVESARCFDVYLTKSRVLNKNFLLCLDFCWGFSTWIAKSEVTGFSHKTTADKPISYGCDLCVVIQVFQSGLQVTFWHLFWNVLIFSQLALLHFLSCVKGYTCEELRFSPAFILRNEWWRALKKSILCQWKDEWKLIWSAAEEGNTRSLWLVEKISLKIHQILKF